MFRAPFRAPFGRGIQTKKIAEGGSEATVGVATEAGGQKIAVGGTEVSLFITTEGGGIKIVPLGGAEAAVCIAVDAGGLKVARSPPAEAEVLIIVDGGGEKIAEGGSETGIVIATEGGGIKQDFSAYVYIATEGGGAKTGIGGAEAAVKVITETAGVKIASGGSEVTVGVTTETGSVKRAVSGAEATITVSSEGGGTKRAVGGAETAVQIEADSAGTKTAAGGSEAVVCVETTGGGGVYASGGSETAVGIAASGGGTKIGLGGAETCIIVATTGGGKKVVPPAYEPDRELRAKVLVTTGGVTTEYDDQNIAAISLDETVNPGDSFSIGSAASAKLEFTLANIPRETNLDGAVIKPFLGFVEGDLVAEYLPLGVFNVEEIDWRKDGNITSVALTCFDNMVRLETAYILSGLTYPASLRAVAQEIAQKAGVVFNAVSLAAIPADPVEELMGYTLREAIGFVASYVGGFAHFNRSGELEISTYLSRRGAQGTPLPDISPANCIAFEISENEFTIGRLACQAGEDEDGNPLVLVSGYTGNEITFENPWMTQVRLDALHQELSQLSYMSYTLRWQGDPALRAGDTVSIADRKGDVYTTLLMEQSLRYDGGLGATAEAKGKTELAQEFQSAGPLTLKLSRQASVKAYADRVAQMIVDGEFEGGTFIDQNMIFSPIIAGMEGRFTGELKVGTGNNLAGISGDGSAAGSIRFWAGHATKTQAPFRVTQDGSLYASKATITGTINATGGTFSGNISVTGTISGGTISGATITGGSIDISSGQFRVTSTGRLTARNVDIRGYIDATSGYFEEVEIYSARFRGDGVYNDYGGAARWKRSDSVYLSQSDSDFGVRFSGGTMFASRSNGRVEALHGKMYAEGFEQYSSRELKKNIVPLEKSALSMISAIPIYEYEFKKEATLSSKKHIGPMAEDMPETMTDEVLRENKTFKTISISDMVGLLWKAVQELSEKVDGLGGAKE